MKLSRWRLVVVVVVWQVAFLLGWISQFISWLDGLGSGTQALVVSAITVGIGLGWSVIKRICRWAYRHTRLRMASRDAMLSLLEPKARLGLVEVADAEPKAIARFTAAMEYMTAVNTWFNQQAQGWTAKVSSVQTKSQKEKLFVDLGKLVRKFGDDMNKGAKDYKSAASMLADCWSSRLYWHDQRQSGTDIIQAAPKVEELRLQSLDTAANFQTHKEKIAGLRGWTKAVDQACDRYCAVMDDLNGTAQAFNVACLSVQNFYKERSGLRGGVRRFLVALRFWAR